MSERKVNCPPRPALPLALWCLGATTICIRAMMNITFTCGLWKAKALTLLAFFAAFALGAIQWRLLKMRTHKTMAALCCVAACSMIGVGCAGIMSVRVKQGLTRLEGTAMSTLRFEMISDARQTATGYRCRAHVWGDGVSQLDVWLITDVELWQGELVSCVGRLKPLAESAYGMSSWAQGVCATVRVVRLTERTDAPGIVGAFSRMRRTMAETIDGSRSETRALVASCICADRRALSTWGVDEVFASCGLSHLAAVSGAHLALLSHLMGSLLERSNVAMRLRLGLLLIFTGLFVMLCGCPISAVRAWLMSMVATGSWLVGRRAHALSSCSLVALALELSDPHVAGQLSFQLSVLSVVGLCVYARHASYTLDVVMPMPKLPYSCGMPVRRAVLSLRTSLIELLGATLTCQLVTLPVSVPTFGMVSLVAPAANLLAAPLISVLLPVGALACGLSWQKDMAEVLLKACECACQPVVGCLRSLARMPISSITVVQPAVPLVMSITILAIWLIWWPRPNRDEILKAFLIVCLVVLTAFMRYRCFAPASLVVLDVGQGDAILVQDGPNALLVDAGPGDAVLAALARRHVLHLDAVVITHLHDDHYGGVEHLSGSVACDRIIVAQGVDAALPDTMRDSYEALTNHGPEELSYGDILHVGRFALRMVWPHESVDGDENCESIQLLVTFNEAGDSLTALLTGDAEWEELQSCVDVGDVGDIDMLKVGHHGSAESLTQQEANAIAAEVAVASAGEGNRYGHPTDECIETLEASGSLFICTKDVGDVEVRPGKDGPSILLPGVTSDLTTRLAEVGI